MVALLRAFLAAQTFSHSSAVASAHMLRSQTSSSIRADRVGRTEYINYLSM
jgi:hypothetical protein